MWNWNKRGETWGESIWENNGKNISKSGEIPQIQESQQS